MNVNKIDSISESYSDGSRTGVILAKSKDGRFITWNYTTHNGSNELARIMIWNSFNTEDYNCYYGHYFSNIEEAVLDYIKRGSRL